MRTLQGTIVSNRMAKTVVVKVDRLKQHPKYRKFYRVSRKYKTHVDDAKAFNIGDVVVIQETRPISKGKRWKVTEVIKRMPAEQIKEEQAG